MTIEGLRLKILKIFRIEFSDLRRKKLKNTDFTIISNNCWGGMIYESYNLPKQSPTVGMFFMADDYIKFIYDLKGYINGKLKFISPEDSKWKDQQEISGDKRFGSYPVGVLSNGKDDIEIFFLHYKNKKEAREKWERRCKRINWKRLLIKFNDQNGCTEQHIQKFNALPYSKKICFCVKEYPNLKSVINIRVPKSHKFIRASYEPFGEYGKVNITKLLNSISD